MNSGIPKEQDPAYPGQDAFRYTPCPGREGGRVEKQVSVRDLGLAIRVVGCDTFSPTAPETIFKRL